MFRLKNPPPIFVGRSEEITQLRSAMRRGHLTTISGPGGIGKTSLVLQALSELGPDVVKRAISLAVSPRDVTGDELATSLLGALRRLAGASSSPAGALADPESFFATCIDLADEHDALVVIDDAHEARSPLLSGLFEAVTAYARKARFIVTSRVELDVAGADGQSIRLGPMSARDLLDLALAWSPALPLREAEEAARDAEGSPFWLKQRLAIGRGSAGSLGREILGSVPDGAAMWLRLLSRLEAPLPLEALSPLAPSAPPLSEALPLLEARGLVETTSTGLRLHAVARLAIRSSAAPPPHEIEALMSALAASPWPGAVLEAVRAYLESGQRDRAAALLTSVIDEAARAGLAPRLWQILEGTTDEMFRGFRLRAAVEIGGGRAIEWAVSQPVPARPQDRLAWTKALGYAGRLLEAAEAAHELAAESARVSDEIAFEALFFGVRCLVTMGRGKLALERAQRAAFAMTPERRASLDAWCARAHLLAGADEAALRIVTHQGSVSSLPDAAREDVEIQRAIVLCELGRARAARLSLVRAGPASLTSPEVRGAQRRLVRETALAVELGRLDQVDDAVGSLRRHAAGSAELSALLAMIDLRLAATRGDTHQGDASLRDLRRHATVLKSTYWDAWLPAGAHLWAIVTAERYEAQATPGSTLPISRALAALHEVVSEGVTRLLEREPVGPRVDAAVVLRLAASRAALLRGDLAAARDEAAAAIDLAEEHELELWAWEARLGLADALLLSGSPDLDVVARQIAGWAELARAPRFAHEARFYRAACGAHDPDATVMDELARSGKGAVAAVRRSRALFGFQEPLDRVDLRVVAALGRRMGMEHVSDDHAYRAGLLLDTRRSRVRLPAGGEVDLGGKPLSMRLLVTLFERGGAASKAELVRAVWSRADYHPLRDDKRLQVAIGRLRVALGDDVADPQLVLTTPDGYRFPPLLPVHRV